MKATECRSVTSSFCKLFHSNLKPHRETETVAVRICAIAGATESEDTEVRSLTKSHTNLSYLSLDPNRRIQH